jgi:hypothetical protein
MITLHDLLRLFSLEVLDTRFFIPAKATPKEALEEVALDPAKPLSVQNGRSKDGYPADGVQPSRWNTPEFYLYYLVHLICVPLMFKSVLDVSKGQLRLF